VGKSLPRGTVGVVARSREEVFLGARTMVYNGLTHPGCMALACPEALDIADDLTLRPVHVTSDYLEVANGLHGNYLGVFW
jgi:hypothetical protein